MYLVPTLVLSRPRLAVIKWQASLRFCEISTSMVPVNKLYSYVHTFVYMQLLTFEPTMKILYLFLTLSEQHPHSEGVGS